MYELVGAMSTSIGNKYESQAVDFLEARGFEIVDRNWRTRRCEIDIVAKDKQAHYFIEVKYRRNENAGHPFLYITPQKQRRMQQAAETWVQEYEYQGQYQLSGIAIMDTEIEWLPMIASLDQPR